MARPNCGNFFGPKIIKAIMLMTTRLVGPVMPKIKVLVIMIINLTLMKLKKKGAVEND